MGKIFKFFKKNEEKEKKVKAAKESNAIQSLNRQIRIMERTQEFLENEVEKYRELASYQKEGNMQDKLLDAGLRFFGVIPTPENPQPTQQKLNNLVSESGQILNDDQIKSFVDQMTPQQVEMVKKHPENEVTKYIKQSMPNISTESIIKGIQMVKNEI